MKMWKVYRQTDGRQTIGKARLSFHSCEQNRREKLNPIWRSRLIPKCLFYLLYKQELLAWSKIPGIRIRGHKSETVPFGLSLTFPLYNILRKEGLRSSETVSLFLIPEPELAIEKNSIVVVLTLQE